MILSQNPNQNTEKEEMQVEEGEEEKKEGRERGKGRKGRAKQRARNSNADVHKGYSARWRPHSGVEWMFSLEVATLTVCSTKPEIITPLHAVSPSENAASPITGIIS